MQVELGTPSPIGRHDDDQHRPVITYANIPDSYKFDPNVNTEDWRTHLTQSVMRNNGITNFDGAGAEEALCILTHPGGAFHAVSSSDPTWAWSDHPGMQRFLSEYYQIPEGRPDFVDETHWRRAGRRTLPPGVSVNTTDMDMLIVNAGLTSVSYNVGGGAITPVTGNGTAATSTTLTTALTTSSTTQYTGARVYVYSTTGTIIVWGNILSCTSGSNAVLTVDQWYVGSTPGGVAATTPSTPFSFLIADGGDVSAWFMALTTTSSFTPGATDTTLSAEATTNGMSRKISAFVITSAASGTSITWTNSATFTYSGSGATTFTGMGLFASAVKTATNPVPLFWETAFSGSFTVTNSGDTATVTDTITGT